MGEFPDPYMGRGVVLKFYLFQQNLNPKSKYLNIFQKFLQKWTPHALFILHLIPNNWYREKIYGCYFIGLYPGHFFTGGSDPDKFFCGAGVQSIPGSKTQSPYTIQ